MSDITLERLDELISLTQNERNSWHHYPKSDLRSSDESRLDDTIAALRDYRRMREIAPFPLNSKVKDLLSELSGTVVALDIKYEIEAATGQYWTAWHRSLEVQP